MPTKRVPCWKDKPVFVSVCVERPKRRSASTTRHHHHHHHHHHHVHHTITQEVIHHGDGAGGKGYTTSRRAELLQYSQRLRQSARTTPPSKPYQQSTTSVPNPNHTSNPQPQAEIVAVPRKPKNAKAPSCFGNCNLPTIFGPLTSFHAKKERRTRTKRSGYASNKIKAAIKILKVQKQQDFSPSCSQHQQSESETETTQTQATPRHLSHKSQNKIL